jgi:PAS domain S-box-containing protein
MKDELGRSGEIPEVFPFPVAVFGPRSLRWSNTAFDRLVRTREGTAPKTVGQLFGKKGAESARVIAQLFEVKGTAAVTATLQDADGVSCTMEVFASSAGTREERTVWLALVDVSDREQERVRLAADAARYAALLGGAAWAAALVRGGRFERVSPGLAALLGSESPDQTEGRSALAVLRGEDKHTFTDMLRRVGAGDVPSAGARMTLHRTDDSTVAVEVDTVRVDPGPEPAVAVHFTPVAERASAEAESERHLRNFRIHQRIMEQAQRTLEVQPILESTLDVALKSMGYTEGAWFLHDRSDGALKLACSAGFPEHLAQKLSALDAREGFGGFFARTLEPMAITPGDWPPHLPFRAAFESDGVALAALVPAGSDARLHALMVLLARPRTARTVSDPELLGLVAHTVGRALGNAFRHEAAEAERVSVTTMVEEQRDVLYRCSPAGAVEYMSPAAERVLGYRPHEFMTSPDLWRTIIHPDDRSMATQRITNREAPGDAWTMTYRMLPRGKASYRMVRESFRYRRAPDGTVLAIVGSISGLDDAEAPQASTEGRDAPGEAP